MQSIKWQKWLGIVACCVLIISCFMHWTWYPDIQKFFTGFFSQNNYYGRPGILLSFFGGTGIILYLVQKQWAIRLNFIFSAICMAYAITSFLRYSSAYDGFVPDKQPGIYLMLGSSIVHLLVSIIAGSVVKVDVPKEGVGEISDF